MGLTYFKRFRMELNLAGELFVPPPLPDGYRLVPWTERLLEAHAEVNYRSFRSEIDANVFPCLGQREGCRRLMSEIARRNEFLEDATWLMEFSPAGRRAELCGTIQGLCDRSNRVGAIQNVGITPAHRGLGLGSILLHQALQGFQLAGMQRAYLEVTAQNQGAIRLYRRLGFRQAKVVYKAAEVAFA